MRVIFVFIVYYNTCVVCVMLLFRRVLSGPKSHCIVLLTGYLLFQCVDFFPGTDFSRNQIRSIMLPMSPPFLLFPPVSKTVLAGGSSLQV